MYYTVSINSRNLLFFVILTPIPSDLSVVGRHIWIFRYGPEILLIFFVIVTRTALPFQALVQARINHHGERIPYSPGYNH